MHQEGKRGRNLLPFGLALILGNSIFFTKEPPPVKKILHNALATPTPPLMAAQLKCTFQEATRKGLASYSDFSSTSRLPGLQ